MTSGLQFCTGSRGMAQRNKRITTQSAYITLHTRFQNLAPSERGQCESEVHYPLRPPIIWSCAHRAPPQQECVDKRPQKGPWRTAHSDLFPVTVLPLKRIIKKSVFWTGHLFCLCIQITEHRFFLLIIRRLCPFSIVRGSYVSTSCFVIGWMRYVFPFHRLK